MRRALPLVLALTLAACAAPNPAVTPTPAPTRDPNALNVTALLDLSGSRAPNGAPQRDAMQLWADEHSMVNPRVRLKVVDVAGSAARTALELRRAAVEDRADAIVIGATVEYDAVFANAVQLTGVPVLFTLPIADPAASGGGWAFALAPTPAQLARAVIDDAVARAPLTAPLVVSDETASATVERAALMAELARRGTIASFTKVTAADATARLRPMLAGTAAVILAGSPKTYIEAARGAGAGASVYLSYACDVGDPAELRETAAAVTWPGTRWIATPFTVGGAERVAFMQSYLDRFGPATSPAASAFDALTLLWTAAANGIAPTAIRDRLQAVSIGGVATTYSFSPTRRAGFAMGDLTFLRYTAPRAAPIIR